MLAALSVLRYLGFNADMFDLGNMAQAIASVRRGEPLVFTYGEGQFSRLALHVELFYLLLALPYALWPDPRLLLLAQAALYALGAIPVYALAARRLSHGPEASGPALTKDEQPSSKGGQVGPWSLVLIGRTVANDREQARSLARAAGLAAALIYLLFPVAQTAVLLDIHGDTLAMPFLLFALDALDRRAWRSYALWLALALSCKFYVAAPVALLGLLVWWCYGERRAGLLTIGAGLAYGLLAFFVIRPLFTTAETSSLHRGANYLAFYFGQAELLLQTANLRVANALVLFAPLLIPLTRGWIWLLPGLPIVAAALLSTVDGSYAYGSHHYAIAVPFLVMAAIDGIDRRQRRVGALARYPGHQAPPAPRRPACLDLGVTLLCTALFSLALVDTPLSPLFWSGQPNRGLDPSRYGVTSRDALKEPFLHAQIPADAPIAVSLHLAPHLTDRETLYLVRYEVNQQTRSLAEILPEVTHVSADALYDYRVALPGGGVDGGPISERAEIGQLLRDPAFGLVAARDGLLIFRRQPEAGTALAQSIETLSDDGRAAIATFGSIELLGASLEQLQGRRYLASFEWRADAALPAAVAVSRLEGVPDARIAHLPSFALLPSEQWPVGRVVRERFELDLPAELPAGRYSWQVAWYDLGAPDGYATDERSALGSLFTVATIEVR
jgi:uncharacterized membrane protein